jgi:hypothetical protein
MCILYVCVPRGRKAVSIKGYGKCVCVFACVCVCEL